MRKWQQKKRYTTSHNTDTHTTTHYMYASVTGQEHFSVKTDGTITIINLVLFSKQTEMRRRRQVSGQRINYLSYAENLLVCTNHFV